MLRLRNEREIHRQKEKIGSKALRQPAGQTARKSGGQDFLLCCSNVVRNTEKGERIFFRIVKSEGRSRIIVTRLAHGAGIDHVFRVSIQVDRLALGLSSGLITRDQDMKDLCIIIRGKTALYVRVSEKGEPDRGLDQQRIGLARYDDVFVFIARRAMHALYVFQRRYGAGRQCAQKIEIIGGELLLRPCNGPFRDGIEAVRAFEAGAGLVMITTHKNAAHVAHARGHFIGTRAVADDIAQIEDEIEFRCCIQAGLESFKVGVNVGEDEYTHGFPESVNQNPHYCRAVRTQWPGEISLNGIRPCGSDCLATVSSGWLRSVRSVGIARMRPRVYGWRASRKMRATGPISTITPGYITATCSATRETTPRSCEINSMASRYFSRRSRSRRRICA